MPSLAAAEDQLSQHQQEQVRQIIRQHLLENPDIVRDVIIELQRREEESVRTSRVDDIEANGDRLFNSDIDPIGGNPDGEITVVEFFDYNCPYCRRVKPIVKELLSKANRIRYVFKEFPILGESSVQATQIALAIWKSAPPGRWTIHRCLSGHPSGLIFSSPRKLARIFRLKLLMSGGAMGAVVDMVYQGKKLQGTDFRDTGQVWAFNGIANLAKEPFFQVKQDETVLVETVNDTAFVHAMHVHGHHFQVVQRGGSAVDDGQPWRDTFLIRPGQTTWIAFVADNPGKWLLHCHMLEHAAAGMNTWFEVV